MNRALYIPNPPNLPSENEFHECTVGWPCGGEPYSRTLRRHLYRRRYGYSRFWLWASVCVSPQLSAHFVLPYEIWSFPQRMVASLTILLVTTVIAYFLDAALFGEIYDGQSGVPDSPCIKRAEEAAYEWRREWLKLESDAPLAPGDVHFSRSPRMTVPWTMVQTVDLSRVFQGMSPADIMRVAAFAATAMREYRPDTLARKLNFDRRPSVVLITPLTEFSNENVYLWQLFSEPVADRPGFVHRLGVTFWFAGGPLSNRTIGKSDAHITRGHLSHFRDRSLFWPCLVALLIAWPVGVCWLAWKAIKEHRFGERYRDFVANYSPTLGDTLDLWLIARIREKHPDDFVVISDHIKREVQYTAETAREFLHQARNGGAGSYGDGV